MPVLGAHTCMKSLINTPLEQVAADWWGGIDDACKKAFFIAVAVNVLAFGFEMTNLTLHHDDVPQLFIEDTILGHYLGRFGVGWLYYYTQNHYFMPFLQLAEGIVLMSVYGIVVARFWGARKAIDIALKFYGTEQDSPRLTLSEGYRNSLGLCIFLAMAKREAGNDRPLILDDVVVSFDRNHRGMIVELLEKYFADRHDRLHLHGGDVDRGDGPRAGVRHVDRL